MTKKDYVLLADVIKERRVMFSGMPAEYNCLQELAKDMARRLAKENPRFNIETFLTACGVVRPY